MERRTEAEKLLRGIALGAVLTDCLYFFDTLQLEQATTEGSTFRWFSQGHSGRWT